MKKDIVIIGSGPAGIQAAIHASRRKVRVTVLGRLEKSSLDSAHIENYCCTLGVQSGKEMLDQGREQARGFGAEFLSEDVLKITPSEKDFQITTESGKSLKTKSLILAMGISRNHLGIPGEKEYFGRGVSTCVECDANFFKKKKVAVVGNGSAAVSGAILLTMVASEVLLISTLSDISEGLREQLTKSSVKIHNAQGIKEIIGENKKVTALIDNKGAYVPVDGVFIEQGAKGVLDLCMELGVDLNYDDPKFIITDKRQATNVKGIFAAGDVCGPPFQLAKAVGEGCVAGLSAAEYVSSDIVKAFK